MAVMLFVMIKHDVVGIPIIELHTSVSGIL